MGAGRQFRRRRWIRSTWGRSRPDQSPVEIERRKNVYKVNNEIDIKILKMILLQFIGKINISLALTSSSKSK